MTPKNTWDAIRKELLPRDAIRIQPIYVYNNIKISILILHLNSMSWIDYKKCRELIFKLLKYIKPTSQIFDV